MNSFTKKVVDAARAYQQAVEKYTNEKEKLAERQKSGTIAAVEFLSQTEKNNGELDQANVARAQRLSEIVGEYEQAFEQWAVVKGVDATEDMALLTSGMTLDPSDYENLEQNHSGNYTMLKAIKSHAEKNKVSYIASAAIEKEQKQKALLELVSLARGAFNGEPGGFSLEDVAFEDDAEFIKWYGSLDRLIALG